MRARDDALGKKPEEHCNGIALKVALPGGLLHNPTPPVLLSLPAQSRTPAITQCPLNQALQYACNGCPKSPVVCLGPDRMHCPALRTSIPLQPYARLIAIEKPQHIPMPPDPWSPTTGTLTQFSPGIVLFFFFEFVEIYRYIDYDGISPSIGCGAIDFSQTLGRLLPFLYRRIRGENGTEIKGR